MVVDLSGRLMGIRVKETSEKFVPESVAVPECGEHEYGLRGPYNIVKLL